MHPSRNLAKFLGVVLAITGVALRASADQAEEFEEHAPAQYSFAYDVQDPHTGDSKAQFETRNGDVVQGSYSLIEADGTRRIVDYTADSVHGFNAVVRREPATAGVVAVAPVLDPVVSPGKTVSAVAPEDPSPNPNGSTGPDAEVEVLDTRGSGPLREQPEKLKADQREQTKSVRAAAVPASSSFQYQRLVNPGPAYPVLPFFTNAAVVPSLTLV